MDNLLSNIRNFLLIFFGVVILVVGLGSLTTKIPREKTSVSGVEITTKPTQNIPMEELKITDIKEGQGEPAKAGDQLTVHYKGTFSDGTEFDSSYTRGVPFNFTLGAGGVIQGWDEGLVGAKEGGIRKLVIPPHLGYGSAGRDGIPPNSTLIFEVEIVAIN